MCGAKLSPELLQVTLHQFNKCTANEIQKGNIDFGYTTLGRMNVIKEITTKQDFFLY
jgi:hypothetical protein